MKQAVDEKTFGRIFTSIIQGVGRKPLFLNGMDMIGMQEMMIIEKQ